MNFHTNIIYIVVSLFASVGFCSSTIETIISLPFSSTASTGYDSSGAAWAYSNSSTHFSTHNNSVSSWNHVGANSGLREVFWSFDLGSGSYDLISASLDFYTSSIDANTTLYVDYYFSDTAPFTAGSGNDTYFDNPDAPFLRYGSTESGIPTWTSGNTFTNESSVGYRQIVFNQALHAVGDQYLTIRFRRTNASDDDSKTVTLARNITNVAAPVLTYQFTTVPELSATSLFVGTIVLGWIVCSRRRAVRTAC